VGEETLALCEDALRDSPDDGEWTYTAGNVLVNLSGTFARQDRDEEALAAITHCVEVRSRLLERFPDTLEYRLTLVAALSQRGAILAGLGRGEEGLVPTEEAVGLVEETASELGHVLDVREHQLRVWVFYGSHLLGLERIEEAREALQVGVEIAELIEERWPGHVAQGQEGPKALTLLARVHLSLNELETAGALAEEALRKTREFDSAELEYDRSALLLVRAEIARAQDDSGRMVEACRAALALRSSRETRERAEAMLAEIEAE
jgi:tetratricopeptide (TPR) repeat protein